MVQLISLLNLKREVLLLDEPFSGLDQRAASYFAQWINEKKKETNFIVVSHRLEPLVGISDYHVELSKKKLREVREK